MPRTNRTRYTILGSLTYGPMSGYDVKRFIERSVGNFWRESYGQIYPTLKKLEAEGLVEKQTQEGQGRPDRNVYSITGPGQAALREWLVVPAESEVPRHEFMLKLFFGTQMSTEDNLAHIARNRAETAETLKRLKETSELLIQHKKGAEALPFWLLGLRLGIRVNEEVLEWCDEAEAVLRGETAAEDLFHS